MVRGTNAAIVLRKAEKRLLNIRVRQCSFTIAKLEEEYAKREAIVVGGIPAQNSTARNDVTEFLGRTRSLAFEEVKRKHREKFANLIAIKRSREHQRSHDAGKIDKSRWVVNKSNKTLTTDEHSVLEKGLNFAVTPRDFPLKDVLVSTEIACKHLSAPKAQSLRAEVTKCIKKAKRPASNISKGEFKALQELKADTDITILPADKGRSTVILSIKDMSLSTLLSDINTYEVLQKDPTSKFKRELTEMIRRWQREDPMPTPLKHFIYPTSEEIPEMYGLPKIHKANVPLRPIVASRGRLTYNASSVLADILGPLMGKSERHIKNSGDCVDKIKNLEVPPGQKLVSYDVSKLFTSIPVPDAIKAVRIKLDEDPKLQYRTPLSRERILELLSFCLNTTYFTYREVIYKQKHGAAMGSPVSPIIANLYMEGFEEIVLRTAPTPLQYGSDTWTIHLP